MPIINANLVSVVLCIVCTMFIVQLVQAGWQKDGGYTGQYPGGCRSRKECPKWEHCVDPKEDLECPEPTKTDNCRCMYGCVYKGFYLRFEQWRQIDHKTKCKCAEPTMNKTVCAPYRGEF